MSEAPVKTALNTQNAGESPDRRFSVAPMMDWTDRHCRYLHRLIYPQALLYTEMVTTGALLHADAQRFLTYHPHEHPVALQLGGNNPDDMAACARMAEDYGYDEVNINVGCPSDRVQNGAFGACLMLQPELVAECVRKMSETVAIPVTVKHRIGVDNMDEYPGMLNFVDTVAAAGCRTFIVHARKAWLQGLSPRQNREIPPLRYSDVYRLKQERPSLDIIINGGIDNSQAALNHLNYVDGVMIGREIYHNPFAFTICYDKLFTQAALSNRTDVVHQYIDYIGEQLSQGIFLKHMTRHMLGLFHCQPGAKAWRRVLSENAYKPDADIQLVHQALRAVTTTTKPE